jgi:CBS domain-containing protein
MRTSEVLRTKGQDVVTVTGATPVSDLLALLAQHGIGAVVVSEDGRTPNGIVSERDVVRALAERGASVLGEPVSAICSTEVSTVAPLAGAVHEQVTAFGVLEEHAARRVLHESAKALLALRAALPRALHRSAEPGNEQRGHGVGDDLDQVGDVVKYRITELESERSALSDYIATAR